MNPNVWIWVGVAVAVLIVAGVVWSLRRRPFEREEDAAAEEDLTRMEEELAPPPPPAPRGPLRGPDPVTPEEQLRSAAATARARARTAPDGRSTGVRRRTDDDGAGEVVAPSAEAALLWADSAAPTPPSGSHGWVPTMSSHGSTGQHHGAHDPAPSSPGHVSSDTGASHSTGDSGSASSSSDSGSSSGGGE